MGKDRFAPVTDPVQVYDAFGHFYELLQRADEDTRREFMRLLQGGAIDGMFKGRDRGVLRWAIFEVFQEFLPTKDEVQ